MINGLPPDSTDAATIISLSTCNGDGFNALATAATPILGTYAANMPVLVINLDESTITGGTIEVPPPTYIEAFGRRWHLTSITTDPLLATYTEVEV